MEKLKYLDLGTTALKSFCWALLLIILPIFATAQNNGKTLSLAKK
jgi:hypothetical protein